MPQYELNLRDYLRIFRKRKGIIIFTFLVVAIGSLVLTPKVVPSFQASATIKIEERKTIAGLLTEWIVYNPGNIMESESRFITSFPVLMKVGVVMKLIPAEWFVSINTESSDASKSREYLNLSEAFGSLQGRSVKPERLEKISQVVEYLQNKMIIPERVDEVNRIVSVIQSKIETKRVSDTNMIKISATADQPQAAADLANVVSEVYILENLNEKNKQARHARQFIEEQLAMLERKLKDTESKLKHFDEGSSQVRLAGPIEDKLVELQFKLAELLQKYTEKHPQVIQLREQIKGMESQVQGFSDKQLAYTGLAREVEVNRKLYSMLKEKLEEARITEQQKVSDVAIVDPAVAPAAPVAADSRIKVIMGAFMGLILGVAFAFIIETFDTSIGTIEDVENVIKLPVLGIVPPIEEELPSGKNLFLRIKHRFVPRTKSDPEERIVHLFAHYSPQSPITEAFRNIHTNLKLSSERKTILVTSSGPREGKSSVVCNLGLVMAQIGLKTLLVSTDLRRPILCKVFGLEREPGLNEVIMGTAPLESALRNITDLFLGNIGFETIRKTPGIENIWILPSGHLPHNPVEIIDSRAFLDLMAKLKSRFDVIILDSPPVLPVTDASLLAPKVDGVIMVYEIGRTGREGLMRSKVQLEAVNAKILGVILNHTQAQTEQISAYPYYRKYKYYGREDQGQKQQKASEKKKV
ncbi:MAG TPA: polysaccharide biosynthesis tyrosine autokinase [Candidatus Omnitrophota bacterium]|nr:polysaccharide biosynthesis tyrosine autokinase [Candidatus Omnitrophota bacterium]